MICQQCEREQPKEQFLPLPQSIERQTTCVTCLLERYQHMVSFLTHAQSQEQPDQALATASGIAQHAGYQLTCQSTDLPNLNALKQQLSSWGGRMLQRRKIQASWQMEFRCLAGDSCSFHAWAQEHEDSEALTFQVLQLHSCSELRQTQEALARENQQFLQTIEALTSLLPSKKMSEAIQYSTSLDAIKGVFKTIHNDLHAEEDLAIAHVWEGECPWRRARGESNRLPNTEDIAALLSLAQAHQVPSPVLQYIQNNLETTADSSYFQQRGYLFLLCLSPLEDLSQMLVRRVQAMVYARHLLQQDMQLLCYRLLKPMVMRNHIWMISLLHDAYLWRQGEATSFPLPGTTEPTDSNQPNLYDVVQAKLS
ncbi:MAG: hypothetical protein EP343_34340 [Deltaproteobacteria bacterium]|nr:MAG: hypothetical protein EP343_34340 [Deltaproteobacteria bacterium]